MKTTCIKMGITQKKVSGSKMIVLIDQLVPEYEDDSILHITESDFCPQDFKFLDLICSDYTPGVDLIYGYNDPKDRGCGMLFIGQWNDGIA